ncbi:MAG: agmatine deiminase family protein [Candidatus Hydrogenedentes bacterium]|nr:agmatine deiminase family protein [Candidatus Hydrogenedentota bacterium]
MRSSRAREVDPVRGYVRPPGRHFGSWGAALFAAAACLTSCEIQTTTSLPVADPAATPPVGPVRMPAEWEPVTGVIQRWKWLECDDLHRWITEQTLAAGATPYLFVPDQVHQKSISAYLVSAGIEANKVRFIIGPSDSIWARDFAPASIYFENAAQLGLVDTKYSYPNQPLDDQAPVPIAAALGLPLFRADRESNLFTLDWGDFMTDGFGNAFSSFRVMNENDERAQDVIRIVNQYLGIEDYLLMEKLMTFLDKHIDMYMKLLDEETVLVGEYREGVPNREGVERNVQRWRGLKTKYGTPYRIFRVPMPGDTMERDFRTYTNALIVNDRVLVPVYNIAEDETALAVFREAMPGYTIVSYDCSQVVTQNGAIHCMTREIARPQMVLVGHARYQAPVHVGEDITFRVQIWSPAPVDTASVMVQLPGATAYEEIPLKERYGLYLARVTAMEEGEMRYFIKAEAGGITGYKPQNAYSGGYLPALIIDPKKAAQH